MDLKLTNGDLKGPYDPELSKKSVDNIKNRLITMLKLSPGTFQKSTKFGEGIFHNTEMPVRSIGYRVEKVTNDGIICEATLVKDNEEDALIVHSKMFGEIPVTEFRFTKALWLKTLCEKITEINPLQNTVGTPVDKKKPKATRLGALIKGIRKNDSK